MFQDQVVNKLQNFSGKLPLREKCPYLEFSGPYFPNGTEYGEILRIFLYSVRIRENTDQENSEHIHFSCIDHCHVH